MKRKKTLNLFLAAIIGLASFVGCTSTVDSEENNITGTTESSDSSETEEKTEIVIWTMNRHDAKFMQDRVDEYNETNTNNVEVKYEIYTDNYTQAVDMAFQNDNAPDLLLYQENVFAKYVNSGKFADLTQYMDDEFLETFDNNIIDGYNKIDDKIYFVPTCATTNRLFYNKDIFERVGISEPPTSMEEMIEDSKLITSELSSEGIYGFAANLKGFQSGLDRSFFKQGELEQGVRLGFDFGKGEYDFVAYEDLVNGWRELLGEDSAFPGTESLDIDPLRTQFAAGRIGMYISWTHAEPGVYMDQFPMEDEWASSYLPTTNGEIKGAENYLLNQAMLLNAESDNKDQAWEAYKEIFTDTDGLIEYYEQGYGISSVPNVLENADAPDYIDENPALLIGDTDKLYPYTPQERSVDSVIVSGQNMYDTIGALIYNNEDIVETLIDLTDRYNDAYREGIREGYGEEVKIENFDPLNP